MYGAPIALFALHNVKEAVLNSTVAVLSQRTRVEGHSAGTHRLEEGFEGLWLLGKVFCSFKYCALKVALLVAIPISVG